MTQSKAQEFLEYIKKRSKLVNAYAKFEKIHNTIYRLPDVEWDDIIATIAVNRLRDPNIGKFKLPIYSDSERLALTEFIWINNTCGLHNSYWSRMWWMVKGGKLIKMFPPNSMLEEFERGERKANHEVYRRH